MADVDSFVDEGSDDVESIGIIVSTSESDDVLEACSI